MNLQTVFEKGRLGQNRGLPTGIPILDKLISGIQPKSIYGIAAAPKVGKTTLADFCFVLSPFEYCMLNGSLDDSDWIYFSYEIDRITKEFKFAAHYFLRDYGLSWFMHKGKPVTISAEYLMGKKLDDDGESILVSEEHSAILQEIYRRRIIPLFGEFDMAGNRISVGKIDFIEEKDNPTGIRNYLMAYARANGTFTEEPYTIYNEDTRQYEHKTRITGWTPNNPNKKTIIITDHIRKPKLEKGFSLKQNVDKLLEYQVELRNWCGFTFVDICHIGRALAAVDRMKFASEYLYPTGDDVKDTGNLSEECNVLITMFNPNDEKYGLVKHFGNEVAKYPNYRSLHIVEAREAEISPAHIFTNMYGGSNVFEQIPEVYKTV